MMIRIASVGPESVKIPAVTGECDTHCPPTMARSTSRKPSTEASRTGQA